MNRQVKVRRHVLLVAAIAASLVARAARGDWGELKLLADDAAVSDDFGRAVAASGHIGLIAAPYDDDDGSFSGSAYLFDVVTGQQQRKLTADDAAADDRFGSSVAIRGNAAIVGSPQDDDAYPSSGSAYLFDVATGQQQHKLTAIDAAEEDLFGFAVAVGGGWALVGADGEDDGGSQAGAAYLFNADTGQELDKFTASDALSEDRFGSTLSLDGDVAIIGAYGNDDSGESSGSAYVFDLAGRQELRKLTALDAAAGDEFGWSVAMSGNLAVIGAPFDDDAGVGSDSGSAYLFNVSTGQQLRKFTAADATADQRFGYSVAIDGNTVVVGAYLDNDVAVDAGASYVFDASTGAQLAKLTASDGASSDYFGYSVGVSGGRALVGAFLNDARGNGAGAAYVYTIPEPATWVLLAVGAAAISLVRTRRRPSP